MSMNAKGLSLLLQSPSQSRGESKSQQTLRKKERDYQKALFDLFVEIETTKLATDSKQVDLAEALYIYSKNQFLRELRRLTCDDEAKTLRYQLWSMSDMNARSLDELGTHWTTAIKNAEHMESDLYRIEQGEIDASSHLRIDVVKEPPPEDAAPDTEKHETEAQNIKI